MGVGGATIARAAAKAARVGAVHTAPVAAAVGELDHLFKREAAAVVEVGLGQRDVAQARGLEGAVDRHPRQRRVGRQRAEQGVDQHREAARVDPQRVGHALAAQLVQVLARERQRIAERVAAAEADVLQSGPHADVVVAVVVRGQFVVCCGRLELRSEAALIDCDANEKFPPPAPAA